MLFRSSQQVAENRFATIEKDRARCVVIKEESTSEQETLHTLRPSTYGDGQKF